MCIKETNNLKSKPNEDPDKYKDTFKLNLRFPGQYYYAETGKHYNINRDYDPVTGRYIQSDPIGFDGGVNTYLYVGGNLAVMVDNEGLFLGILLKEVGKKVITKVSDFAKIAYKYIKRNIFEKYDISDLNTNQLANYKRFIRKIPANPKQSVRNKKDSSVNMIFEAISKGIIPGSKAIYIKVVNKMGRTIEYKKITIDPSGKVYI